MKQFRTANHFKMDGQSWKSSENWIVKQNNYDYNTKKFLTANHFKIDGQ